MTTTAWLGLLCYFAVTSGTGYFAIRSLCSRHSPLVHNWACCYLVGQLVCLILTLITAVTPCPLSLIQLSLVFIVALCGSIEICWRKRANGLLMQVGTALVWVAGVMVVFPDLFLTVQYVPLYEWDARSVWFFHGKAIYLNNGISPTFFANPLYAWSLPDYPLLIPSQAAWAAFFQKGWDDYSSKAFLLFNFAAYSYLFYLALGEKRYPWWVKAFVVVVLFDRETYSYVSGIADNHYIMPLILFAFLLSLADWREHVSLLVILTAFGANMKNEGKMYAILILVGAAGLWGLRRLMGRLPPTTPRAWRNRYGQSVILGIGLGVLPVFLWAIFKSTCGISNPVGIVQKFVDMGRLAQLLAERAGTVAGYLVDYYHFKGCQYLVGLIVLLFIWRVLLYRRLLLESLKLQFHEGVVLSLFVVCNMLVFSVYVITPLDLQFHLGTSAGRLLFLPYMMLFLLALHGAEALFALVTPSSAAQESAQERLRSSQTVGSLECRKLQRPEEM